MWVHKHDEALIVGRRAENEIDRLKCPGRLKEPVVTWADFDHNVDVCAYHKKLSALDVQRVAAGKRRLKARQKIVAVQDALCRRMAREVRP